MVFSHYPHLNHISDLTLTSKLRFTEKLEHFIGLVQIYTPGFHKRMHFEKSNKPLHFLAIGFRHWVTSRSNIYSTSRTARWSRRSSGSQKGSRCLKADL